MPVIAVFCQCLALALICMGLMWESAARENRWLYALAGFGASVALVVAGTAVVKLGWVVL